MSKIHDLIKHKKYFLVLDDVWTEDFQKWEPFKIALKNDVHGSRILVTTRKQRAAEVMGSVLTINLELLLMKTAGQFSVKKHFLIRSNLSI